MHDFTDIKVGDEVILRRSRGHDRIGVVSHTTRTQFRIGAQNFFKKNGYAVGSTNSWHRFSAHPVERGDKARISKENRRVVNSNLFSECHAYELTDDELEAIGDIIRSANARMANTRGDDHAG